MTVEFGETNTMDGMTVDNDGILYIIDTTGKLFRIDPVLQTHEIVVHAGLGAFPQDCYFDEANDRLITVNFAGANSFIRGIDLDDYSITTLLNPTFGNFDGVTLDQYGNIYAASYDNGGCIYRIDDSFEYDPVLISTGHTGPAGIEFNVDDNILAIPNFYTNIVDLVPVDFEIVADFSASVISGTAPLEVQFFDETLGDPMVWWWDFDNDGSTDSIEQDPVWTFTENGIYSVKLKVHNGEAEDIEIKTNYIIVEEVDADDSTILPDIRLDQNYPNPFQPAVEGKNMGTLFRIKSPLTRTDWEKMEIVIYDLKGRKTRSLEVCSPLVSWDGKDNNGNLASAGFYFYQLRKNERILDTKKCLLLK